MNPRILAYPLGSIDTHLHTRFSADSTADPMDMARRARSAGLEALVFTDHMEFGPEVFGYGHHDPAAARQAYEEVQAAFPELAIFRGVEITYLPEKEEEIRAFAASGGYDYVLGSIHVIDGMDISLEDPENAFFGGRTQEEAYGRYFEEVLRLVESGIFDGLGHLDLCKRYGHQHYGPLDSGCFEPILRWILEGVLRQEMVLEVNTSGFRQDPREPYPSTGVCRCYLELGGRRLVLGSDAHRPEHVAFRFEEMQERLDYVKAGVWGSMRARERESQAPRG